MNAVTQGYGANVELKKRYVSIRKERQAAIRRREQWESKRDGARSEPERRRYALRVREVRILIDDLERELRELELQALSAWQ